MVTRRKRNVFALLSTMGLVLAIFGAPGAAAGSHCQPAGDTGLSAHYVNEVPHQTLDVTCDIGIYFDEDGSIEDVGINGTVDGALSVQFGIYVSGANVDVSNSTVTVDSDYPHQFLSVGYHDGASGTVRKNEMRGAHRVGVLVRGESTSVELQENVISGTGAKTSGWAENGIQVDQGATVEITNNTVEGHWWDGESNFASAGILLFSSHSSATNNTLSDNEFSIYAGDDSNRITGNKISSTIVSQSSLGFRAYGILVFGSENQLTGNEIDAVNGAAGIYVFPTSERNRLHGNRISGFEWPIVDGGDETNSQGNPAVTEQCVNVYVHPVH